MVELDAASHFGAVGQPQLKRKTLEASRHQPTTTYHCPEAVSDLTPRRIRPVNGALSRS